MLTTCSPELTDDVVDWAQLACQDPQVGVRWRTRFNVPTRQAVESRLRDSHLSLVFRSKRTNSIVSLVQVHDLDTRCWHGQLSVLGDYRYQGSVALGQSLIAGISIAFTAFPIRKLYAEVLPLEEVQESIMRHWKQEGRLVGHYATPSGWKDVVLYAMWRDDFASIVPERYSALAKKWIEENGN